jgi:glycine/D-amino acid oxidase-like deaminating enzyme
MWLEQALDTASASPLVGDVGADVAIVGGGYVGLWTALRVVELEPDARVVIVEGDVCGGGASGRNGGLAHAWWEKLRQLTAICGAEEALDLCYATERALDELETLNASGQVPCNFVRAGKLSLATTPAQLGAWDGLLAACERHGVAQVRRVDADEARRRSGSATHLGGLAEETGATVHPGKLVRGLRQVALARGVRIFEHTPMVALERSRPPVIHTPVGRVRADRVVLALNAWAAGIPELRRLIYVVSSEIVATEPVPGRLKEIGWGGEGIGDGQPAVNYYRTTDDGRVIFGRGGGRLAWGGRVARGFDRNDNLAAGVVASFRRIYPQLADVPIVRHWSGPIDRTVAGIPIFGTLGSHDGILYGVGWSGTGVVQSVIGGRILASLALGRGDRWASSGLVEQRNVKRLPPEPLRFVGGKLVRHAVMRKARTEEALRQPAAVTARLAGLVPKLDTSDDSAVRARR